MTTYELMLHQSVYKTCEMDNIHKNKIAIKNY